MKILLKSLINPETACFCTAIVLYATLGSPTPDAIGWVEILIGLLLICGCIRHVPKIINNISVLTITGLGLILPFLTGLITGNDEALMLRDSIAFIFLILPVFFTRTCENRPRLLLGLFIVLGVIASTRAALPHYNIIRADLAYWANTAGVLFAAIFAISRIAQGKIKDFPLWVCIAIPPLLAMTLTLQRASLAYIALVSAIFLMRTVLISPKKAVLPLIIIAALACIFHANLGVIFHELMQKTYLHGGNMRIEEIKTVWNITTSNILYFFFGQGWGATFESPAVANIRVNYTHNLISATLLKTGFIGLTVITAYAIYIGKHLAIIFKNNMTLFLCIAGPLIIQTVFYAGFKSLDFGLLLLLIVVYGQKPDIEKRGIER